MLLNDVRNRYLTFFKDRGHEVIPSASLVPENDSTTLFTGSGMQPLLPYLLGKKHPKGIRLVNSQRCFRAEDIEEVGDNRHTTFFEMLGNWSLGDYFKENQLRWFFEFLTEGESGIGLDPNKLYVTVFAGDEKNDIPRDDESVVLWKKLFKSKGIEAQDTHIGSVEDGCKRGMREGERIFYYDASKNWWSRAGTPEKMPAGEPGGPDSEIFYDFGTSHDTTFGEHCHPNCDCGRFVEIGNSVFMQYLKREDGSFEELSQKNVDFGGGLERITAATNDYSDIFKIDSLHLIISTLEERTGKRYEEDGVEPFRIIADHIRAAVFMIADGIVPANTDHGYILRRLIRRSVRFADSLGAPPGTLSCLVEPIKNAYGKIYETVMKEDSKIEKVIYEEEERFRTTLERGMREFEKLSTQDISGPDAFILFSTYGFPVEMTEELANDKGISVDRDGFKREMEMHRARSRSGAEQKFKGGLADHSEKSLRYHTATHLLHKALRDVLGEEVVQKGSNITGERLRFDFSFPRKMTAEEKERVENTVNEKITQNMPVSYEDLPIEEARKRGAIGLFEEKYGDTVRVYSIKDYSIECCGGPHVANTGELGMFRITKEESVSAGVRRIKAVLE